MKWIHRGIQIGQTVKNAHRLQVILTIFAKHGFDDIVSRLHLEKIIPGGIKRAKNRGTEKATPQRVREAFEKLGPTFIKLGQLLATRSDLLPDEYIEEFLKLQDNVDPLPFSKLKSVLESELGKSVDQLFHDFDENPLASASIAQVHSATLPTGEKVVVKIQRPGIMTHIESDLSLLQQIARLLERYVPESKIFRPAIIIEEFFKTLILELDFNVESNNIQKITSNFKDFPDVVIPAVYKNYTTKKVITLERLDGIPLKNLAEINRSQLDKRHLVETGARAFFKSVLIDGLFHGDLHGGNLFALPDNRLGLIDFGIVGRLSQQSRDQFAAMVMFLLTEDYENLCYQYAELGDSGSSIDFDGFQREVRNAISPYLGLNMADVNSGKILVEATRIATKYGVYVPGDWMLVFKALVSIEGLGRTLDPDFNVLDLSSEFIKELVKTQYSYQRISKDLLWVAKDFSSLFRIFPRQIRWMFRKLNSNDFAFEIKSPQFEEVRKEIRSSSKRNAYSILAGSSFVAGSLSLGFMDGPMLGTLPLLSAALLCLGIFFTIGSIKN